MKRCIYHVSGNIGISSEAFDCPVHEFASEFLLAICWGEDVAYSGTLRALRALLNSPRIHQILLDNKHLADNALSNFAHLRSLVSALEDM